jgi:hypothetical protein
MQLDNRNSWSNHFPGKYLHLLDMGYLFLLLQMEYSFLLQASAMHQLKKHDMKAFKKLARVKAITNTANDKQPQGLAEAQAAAAMLVQSLRDGDPRGGVCRRDLERNATQIAKRTPDELKA